MTERCVNFNSLTRTKSVNIKVTRIVAQLEVILWKKLKIGTAVVSPAIRFKTKSHSVNIEALRFGPLASLIRDDN
jgi:hypothetical protein